MWPDRVSKPGPLTYESGALRGPAPSVNNIHTYIQSLYILAQNSHKNTENGTMFGNWKE